MEKLEKEKQKHYEEKSQILAEGVLQMIDKMDAKKDDRMMDDRMMDDRMMDDRMMDRMMDDRINLQDALKEVFKTYLYSKQQEQKIDEINKKL
jgi:hypothetical protein